MILCDICSIRRRLSLVFFQLAMAKFPEALLDRVLALTTGLAVSGSPPARRVLHIDGVSFTLAATPENRARYDNPSGQIQGCSFPVMSAFGRAGGRDRNVPVDFFPATGRRTAFGSSSPPTTLLDCYAHSAEWIRDLYLGR